MCITKNLVVINIKKLESPVFEQSLFAQNGNMWISVIKLTKYDLASNTYLNDNCIFCTNCNYDDSAQITLILGTFQIQQRVASTATSSEKSRGGGEAGSSPATNWPGLCLAKFLMTPENSWVIPQLRTLVYNPSSPGTSGLRGRIWKRHVF